MQQQAGINQGPGSNRQPSIRDEAAADSCLYGMRQQQAAIYTRRGSSRQEAIRDEATAGSYLYVLRQHLTGINKG